MKTNLHALLFSPKEINLGWMSDIMCHRASSVFLRISCYFDCIITNADNASLHKYIKQNGGSVFKTIQKLLKFYFSLKSNSSPFD